MYAVGKAVFNSTGARKNDDWIYVFNIEVCVYAVPLLCGSF